MVLSARVHGGHRDQRAQMQIQALMRVGVSGNRWKASQVGDGARGRTILGDGWKGATVVGSCHEELVDVLDCCDVQRVVVEADVMGHRLGNCEQKMLIGETKPLCLLVSTADE